MAHGGASMTALRPLLLAVGIFDWRYPLSDPVQQMAPHFLAAADVVFVAPVRRRTLDRRLAAELAGGIPPVFWRVTGHSPGGPIASPLSGRQLYLEMAGRPLVLYVNSYAAELGGELVEMLAPDHLIYDVYEHVVSPDAPLAAAHGALWQAATVRVALNERVAAAMTPLPPTLLAGAAVDPAHFEAAARHEGPYAYAFGFVGNFANWTDMASLEAVAQRFPTERMLLVGPCPPTMAAQMGALTALPNVDWRPPIPYADLPEVLRGVEVLLLPRTRQPAAEASDPLKLYDYLATGRPIVATPLPGAAPLPAGTVYWGVSGAPFADAADSALAEHRTHPRGAAAQGRIAVAHRRSWKVRTQKILAAAGLPPREA